MKETPKHLRLLVNIARYFGFLMVFVYLALGLYMIFSNAFIEYLSKLQTNSIGILLITYGTFRGYRVFKENKN